MSSEFDTPEAKELYLETMKRAFPYALSQTWDKSVAREIASHVAGNVVRLWAHRISEFGAKGSRAGYVYTAVSNRVLELIAKEERRTEVEQRYLGEADDGRGVDELMEAEELKSVFQKVVSEMPDGMRKVWCLKREGKLSYEEMSQLLGIGIGTIGTQLQRAAALLRDAEFRYKSEGLLPAKKKKRGPVPGTKRQANKQPTDQPIGGTHTI